MFKVRMKNPPYNQDDIFTVLAIDKKVHDDQDFTQFYIYDARDGYFKWVYAKFYKLA